MAVPHHPKGIIAPRHDHKSAFKKAFANLRFNVQKARFTEYLTPLLLTILCFFFIFYPLDDQLPSSTQTYTDPCAVATPQPLIHFDPRSRVSSEFRNPDPADVDPASVHRIFATFFKTYLFQLQPGHILSIPDAGRGRLTDIRDSLFHAQRALRSFYADPSIVVTAYSLGYNHLDRVRGSRYIFHLVSNSDTNPERHDVVSIQRTFDATCQISVKEYPPKVFEDAVYLVVPYSKRPKRLKWFLDQFDQLIEKEVKVQLVLAVCKEIGQDVEVANRLVKAMRYPYYVHVVSTPGDKTAFFSRAVSIRDGARVAPDDSIIFLSDIDMYIFPTMFDSCRLNSIRHSQVYFPVFYSLYPGNTRIDRRAGYWRDSSFGMSCMYKSDFEKIAAYKTAESSFVGWGKEDEALYQAFRNNSDYEVFRAIEPALRHKWHPKLCEPYTPFYSDCLTIKYKQLGEMATVGKVLLDEKVDAQNLFADYADEGDDDGDSDGQNLPDPSKKRSLSEIKKLLRRQAVLKHNSELLKKKKFRQHRNEQQLNN